MVLSAVESMAALASRNVAIVIGEYALIVILLGCER
jgi:hypothetical protein